LLHNHSLYLIGLANIKIDQGDWHLGYLIKGGLMLVSIVQTKSKAAARALMTVLVVIVGLSSTSAMAVTGREAVGNCIDSTATGARCGWAVSKDGSIDVCDKTGCVTCPSATSECTPAKKNPKRPLKYSTTPSERFLNKQR
jgi:uncharacterized membrane protein (UPF0182 family)